MPLGDSEEVQPPDLPAAEKGWKGGDGSEKTTTAARAEDGCSWVEVIGWHKEAERRARPTDVAAKRLCSVDLAARRL
uniref:Uncharacterized protein n=1 Tax=Oryza barthii TaxID=65489 RepID=A0A0D3HU94_9ORYZ